MRFSDEQMQQLKEVVKEVVDKSLHERFKKELAPIKRDMRAMRKDLDWVMGKYDTRLCSLELHTTHPPKPVDFSLAI